MGVVARALSCRRYAARQCVRKRFRNGNGIGKGRRVAPEIGVPSHVQDHCMENEAEKRRIV